MRAFRYQWCEACKKRRYATEESAAADLVRFAALPKGDKVPVRAYFNDACGWWHVTSRQTWEAPT